MRVSPTLISPALASRWSLDFASALGRSMPLMLDLPFTDRRTALLQAWGLTEADTQVRSYTAQKPMSDWAAAAAEERTYDTAPLSLARVKLWAKAVQGHLGKAMPLNLCQTALAQAMGCSAWSAVPGRLAQINAERAAVRDRLAAEALTAHRKAHPPLAKGDWVIERIEEATWHPTLGKVRDAYYDSCAHEWVIDLVLYDADGRRLGRTSPRMGGPGGFEPAVPAGFYQRMLKPEFPMERDRTGYRDWRGAAEVLPDRNAPAPERRRALTELALVKLAKRIERYEGKRLPPPGKDLDEVLAKVHAKHANADDPADFIPRQPLVLAWADAQEHSWYASKSPQQWEEEAQLTGTMELHRHITDVALAWRVSPPQGFAQWSQVQRRERLVEAGFAAYVAEVDGILPPEAVIRPPVDDDLLAEALARLPTAPLRGTLGHRPRVRP